MIFYFDRYITFVNPSHMSVARVANVRMGNNAEILHYLHTVEFNCGKKHSSVNMDMIFTERHCPSPGSVQHSSS